MSNASGRGSVFWPEAAGSTWKNGGDSDPYAWQPEEGAIFRSRTSSSFALLDRLVARLVRAVPSLRLVTVAGFSAGGQFLNVYALASRLGSSAESWGPLGRDPPVRYPPVERFATPHVRFVVSDPSIYLYLDDTRPAPSCLEYTEKTAKSRSAEVFPCEVFAVPKAEKDAPSCMGYNDYRFGLDRLWDWDSEYLSELASEDLLRGALGRFRAKDLVLMLGDKDVCSCNSEANYNAPDDCFPTDADGKRVPCMPTAAGVHAGCCDSYPDATVHNAVVSSCEAALQGSNRFQRGLLYAAHLERFFGGGYKAQVVIVRGMRHDSAALLASADFNCFSRVGCRMP
jgi:hypothetical protein